MITADTPACVLNTNHRLQDGVGTNGVVAKVPQFFPLMRNMCPTMLQHMAKRGNTCARKANYVKL